MWILGAGILAGLVLVARNQPIDRSSLLHDARAIALSVLRAAPRGATIVFDFDSTLFNEESVVDWEYTGTRSVGYASDRTRVPLYAPIAPITDILQVALARGFRVVLITARLDNAYTRATVSANLKRRGLRIHEFFARKTGQPPTFKAQIRGLLATQAPVALTIGDNWYDVTDPGKAAWIKLPSKSDTRMYSSHRNKT